MEPINFKFLNVIAWEDQLKKAVERPNGKANYIYGEKATGYRKLSVKEITEISIKNIQVLSLDPEHDYKDLSNRVVDLTKQLIDLREGKWKFLRTAALIISAIASFIIIGIPIFIYLRNANIKFQNEIRELKEKIAPFRIDHLLEQVLKEDYADVAKKYGPQIQFLKENSSLEFLGFLESCKKAEEDFLEDLNNPNGKKYKKDDPAVPFELNPNNLAEMYMFLQACTNPLLNNSQIHSDSVLVDLSESGVFTLNELEKGTGGRLINGRNGKKTTRNKMSKVIEKVKSQLDTEIYLEAKDQLQYDDDFLFRGDTDLMQKSSWIAVKESVNGGFGSAYRVISFKNMGGEVSETIEELDLSEFKFNREQSKDALIGLKLVGESLRNNYQKCFENAAGDRQNELLNKVMEFDLRVQRGIQRAIRNVPKGGTGNPLVSFIYLLDIEMSQSNFPTDFHLAKPSVKASLINEMPPHLKEPFMKLCKNKTEAERIAILETIIHRMIVLNQESD